MPYFVGCNFVNGLGALPSETVQKTQFSTVDIHDMRINAVVQERKITPQVLEVLVSG